jgi:hypothetical protein
MNPMHSAGVQKSGGPDNAGIRIESKTPGCPDAAHYVAETAPHLDDCGRSHGIGEVYDFSFVWAAGVRVADVPRVELEHAAYAAQPRAIDSTVQRGQ